FAGARGFATDPSGGDRLQDALRRNAEAQRPVDDESVENIERTGDEPAQQNCDNAVHDVIPPEGKNTRGGALSTTARRGPHADLSFWSPLWRPAASVTRREVGNVCTITVPGSGSDLRAD